MTGVIERCAFRAQVRGVSGWVDGGLFVYRKDADADAARLAGRYDAEVRVIEEPVSQHGGAK